MTQRRSRREDESLGGRAMDGGYGHGSHAVCQCGRAVFLARVITAAIALVCVLAAMTVAPKIRAQALEGTVSIVPGASTAGLKEGTFTVFIVLEGLEHHGTLAYDDNRDSTPDREVQSDGLAAFEFTIRFDPALLQPEAASLGPDLGRTGRQFQCLQPVQERGSFSFGCISIGLEPAGPQGTLTLAAVTFQPLSAGSSPLLLEAQLAGPLGSDQVPVRVYSGAVRVTGDGSSSQTAATSTNDSADVPPGRAASHDTPTAASSTWRSPAAGATAGPGATPAGGAARALAGDRDGADAVSGDFEAESGSPAAADGGGTDARWWGVVAGAVATAVGVLAVAGVAWRRHRMGGGLE